jgi:hypothetical protein
LILVAGATCYNSKTYSAPLSINSGVIINDSLYSSASAVPVPAWHSTAKGALLAKKDGGESQQKKRDRHSYKYLL